MNKAINYVGNIDFFRERLKLTNKKMCQLANISLSSYNDMCKRNTFYTATLEKIATALNVEVSDLVKNRNVDDKKEMLNDFEEIKSKLDDFKQKHIE